MMSKKTIFTINQTLHGYQDGHTLISSSIDLSPETKRLLLIMSDMSGPSMQTGFEEYLTGYPIKELNAYALAKTWYAPEMKRPGCVWTQTFLINFSDLSLIDDLSSLVNLFERPRYEKNDLYSSKPLVFEQDEDLNHNRLPNFDEKLAKEVISQLYTKAKSSIIIKSVKPTLHEGLVLNIWQQQWPRLRRNFTFCTGSISLRFFNSKMLDLQIMPWRGDNNIYSISNIKIIEENMDVEDQGYEPWIELALNDIRSTSRVRNFLKVFGIDVKADRSSFKPLMETYEFLNKESEKPIDQVITTLSHFYPTLSDANHLKVTFLGQEGLLSRFYGIQEKQILEVLAKTECYKSFDYDKLKFEERFETLFEQNRDMTFEILNDIISTETNKYGEKVIKNIALKVTASSLDKLSFEFKNLIYVFLALNPKLAHDEKIWRVGLIDQKELLATLMKNQLSEVDWQEIINILISQNLAIDHDLLSSGNIPVIKYILNSINKTSQTEIHYRWLNVLETRPEELVDWVGNNKEITDSLLSQLISYLNPNSQTVLSKGSKVWLDLVYRVKYSNNKVLVIKLNSFALALSFNNFDNNAFHLAIESFEVVYNAAANDSLEYNSWKYIEVHTKPLNFWNDWDKCKKLVVALVEKSSIFGWPLEKYSKRFNNKSILKRLDKLQRPSSKS